MLGLFALIGLGSALKRPASRPLGDSTQKCIFCHFYVSLIQDYLKDGATVEVIVKKAEELCKYTKPEVQPVCVELVDKFLPTIIELIEKETEVHDICKMIKLCKD